ncbi:selenocysteine lyase [Thecamonas trahens ATCC 50062]|uniref:Selenocysteine lyase n=1 Tax=Thecamonas trahens ATCC 50062 TaxID=461836 RepID=A0A0L0DL09_THETB|nr:selenocysteine lyase [Thecamonas trahens ATCC 50062]KNC52945.1 selenocysteine lyase [Thecamonas trahens ATCC 50062]|eukprot:XP_013754839.1 selenocysteine lyase [Thecamonas trahens ATCC 50062]
MSALREHFLLSADHVHLNHGSFGATPKAVLAAQSAAREAIELHPDAYYRSTSRAAFADAGGGELASGRASRVAARQLAAELFDGEADRLAFVVNATTAANAAVISLPDLKPDECVVEFSPLIYGGCHAAFARQAERCGAELVSIKVSTLAPSVDEFVTPIQEILASPDAPRIRMVLLDHIVSTTAEVLPVADIVPALAAARLASGGDFHIVVDGAHVPGQLPLSLREMTKLGVDVYIGNLHKWMFAPKGAAFVYAASDAGKALMRPPIASHATGARLGFVPEFDDQGTRDDTAWLVLPAALAFIDTVCGGLEAMRASQAAILAAGVDMLTTAWGTSSPTSLDPAAGALAIVPLPPPPAFLSPPSNHHAWALSAHLHRTAGITAFTVVLDGAYYVRISAQIYNTPSDYRTLADAITAVFSAASPEAIGYEDMIPYSDW